MSDFLSDRSSAERHLDLAARLGRLVDAAPDIDLLWRWSANSAHRLCSDAARLYRGRVPLVEAQVCRDAGDQRATA